jgi:hypothetical protein
MLIAASLFARPDKPALTWVAVAGGLLPDLSLYLLVFWSLGVRGESTDKVFGENYFSADWQRIFSIDNSFFVWALVIAIGLYAKREWVWVLGVACIVHVLADFPLHHDDGRAHFWPVSDWVFQSPVSYWDVNHHAGIVAPLEGLLCILLYVYLFWKFRTRRARQVLFGCLAVPALIVGAIALALMQPG